MLFPPPRCMGLYAIRNSTVKMLFVLHWFYHIMAVVHTVVSESTELMVFVKLFRIGIGL